MEKFILLGLLINFYIWNKGNIILNCILWVEFFFIKGKIFKSIVFDVGDCRF